MAYYKTDSDKIDVVGNSAESSVEALEEFPGELDDFIDEGKYFLYLGALHPRKNILGILKAYAKFREKNFRQIKLVIAGRDAWNNEGLKSFAASMAFKEDVKFIGAVSEELKNKLLQDADGFLYCSYFEGFGIPILEAQKFGCPVITSDNSSMEEVGGESVLYSTPSKVGTIVEQLSRLVNEPGLKQSLISKGYENVKRYSWNDSANKMYQIIQDVVQT